MAEIRGEEIGIYTPKNPKEIILRDNLKNINTGTGLAVKIKKCTEFTVLPDG